MKRAIIVVALLFFLSSPVNAATIVAHPAGCPSRAFCGCGTALYLLGKRVVAGGLAIAANWLQFPRAEPGPGMAAARKGHVFAIIKNLGGGKVLAYDPNSGGRKTRIHVRSLRGYTVVNPHGAKQEVTNVAIARNIRRGASLRVAQRKHLSQRHASLLHNSGAMPEKHSIH